MTRTVIYRYLGTNGIIESPVHLEDVYYTRLIKLVADKNHVLTNGVEQVKSILCPEDEEKTWKEVKA